MDKSLNLYNEQITKIINKIENTNLATKLSIQLTQKECKEFLNDLDIEEIKMIAMIALEFPQIRDIIKDVLRNIIVFTDL